MTSSAFTRVRAASRSCRYGTALGTPVVPDVCRMAAGRSGAMSNDNERVDRSTCSSTATRRPVCSATSRASASCAGSVTMTSASMSATIGTSSLTVSFGPSGARARSVAAAPIDSANALGVLESSATTERPSGAPATSRKSAAPAARWINSLPVHDPVSAMTAGASESARASSMPSHVGGRVLSGTNPWARRGRPTTLRTAASASR